MYYSLVYPHLQYCNLIWGCAPYSYTNKILMLQKKIVRIITKSNYLAHTDELFAITNILKVNDLNKYLLGIYGFKLARRDQLQTSMHSYNTRLSSTYVRPAYQRLSVTQNSLSFTVPHVWNSIPADLKNCVTLIVFSNQNLGNTLSGLIVKHSLTVMYNT